MTIFIVSIAAGIVILAGGGIAYDWLCPPVYPRDDPFSWRDDQACARRMGDRDP